MEVSAQCLKKLNQALCITASRPILNRPKYMHMQTETSITSLQRDQHSISLKKNYFVFNI